MILWAAALSIVGVVGCSSGETIDVLTDDYVGDLREEDLYEEVVVLEHSWLALGFFTQSDALWAKATFHGKIQKGLIVLTGPMPDTIEGVTVDGDDLSCIYTVGTAALKVTGTFSPDRSQLWLTMAEVGSVLMTRVEPEDTGEEQESIRGDTGDTDA